MIKGSVSGVNASEVGARPNTWMPTASDVGAAKAGYGLGTDSSFNVSNADGVGGSGWYQINQGTPDANWWLVFASVNNANSQHQKAYRLYDGEQCERYKANGVWGEWGYVNPPMTPGVEYRTTQRWNGQPVYTQLVEFGSLPASTYKDKQFTADYVTNVIEINAIVGHDGIYRNIGMISGVTDISVQRASGSAYVRIQTNTDLSSRTAYIALKYTKD